MFSIIKRILRLSGKYRPRVIAGLIFNALKSCCAAFVFFAVLLVMLNIEHLTETVILQAFGIVALSVLGRFLFQYLSDVLMSASGYEIFREKRLEIGNQLKRAPMGYFTENNLGTVQTVLTTTISDLEGNCMLALTFLVGGFVQALAMTLMLGIFCWQIGFLALTGVLAGILVLGQIKKRAGAHTEDMQNAQELLVGSALEYIKGISVLRIFGKGKEGKGKVDQAFENKCRSDIAVTISTAGIMKLYEAVFKITSCLLFLLSALLYLWGVITLPYCLLFIICAFLMFMELELMNDGAFLSKMLATQLDRLDFISDIPVLDGDGKDIVLKSYEIELKDVIFAYDSRPVLDGITLKIPQNSTCAIVGPSGSGKTTLCNMIARFWDVNSGSVKIGGHDVKEFTCDSLLSYVSMVFQKVYLFNDTIENNIKFGKPNAPHAEVVEAAKRARCHDFIEALPQGYIPQAIVIPVAIILRFLPSLKQDVLYIKQGMKTRGVGLSFWRIVSHPAQTYEGFLIPILMRLLMTATELSASAETRGISYPCEKTHYILVDFRLRDSILLIGMLALFAVVIWTSFQPISF